jgi:hypothetical protein
MKLHDYICFKPPTVYDLIVTIGVVIACLILWNVKESQAIVRASQVEMQRNQITKQYLLDFYINQNQYLFIEGERNRAFDAVRKGADPKQESELFLKRAENVFKLNTRGGEKK